MGMKPSPSPNKETNASDATPGISQPDLSKFSNKPNFLSMTPTSVSPLSTNLPMTVPNQWQIKHINTCSTFKNITAEPSVVDVKQNLFHKADPLRTASIQE